MMDQNQSFWQKNQNYIVAGVIIVLVIIYYATKSRTVNAPVNTNENTNQEQTESKVETKAESKLENQKTEQLTKKEEPKETSGNIASMTTESHDKMSMSGSMTLEGKLMNSDNTAKGNLLLVSDGHSIYIRTSRDFSGLVGKDVKVSGEGSLESFKMSDIVAK